MMLIYVYHWESIPNTVIIPEITNNSNISFYYPLSCTFTYTFPQHLPYLPDHRKWMTSWSHRDLFSQGPSPSTTSISSPQRLSAHSASSSSLCSLHLCFDLLVADSTGLIRMESLSRIMHVNSCILIFLMKNI